MIQPSPISAYTRGYRPRCSVCNRELEPAAIFDHEYPQHVRYSGFHPCPHHPHAGVTYPTIPSNDQAAISTACLREPQL